MVDSIGAIIKSIIGRYILSLTKFVGFMVSMFTLLMILKLQDFGRKLPILLLYC